MKTFEYTIAAPIGLHVRPAGKFVSVAKTFKCDITVNGNNKSVSGKKMIALMSLGLKQHETINLTCEGEDEDKALAALSTFLKETL